MAAVVVLAERVWRRQHDKVHEAIRPFVVWEPWPHPGPDSPPQLLELYRGLTQLGYAKGWM